MLIETAEVELSAEYCSRHEPSQPGRYVMVSVSDTGHGISDEVRAHLFEPFFTTKDQGKGTGLGLATIFGAVAQAGGTIDVCSERGTGTTFKIYLPRTDSVPAVAGWNSRELEMPRGNETILLVEDQEVVRRLAVKILRRLGYEVLQADNGARALDIVENHPGTIHVLLTDVVMPGMSGPELAERSRAQRPDMQVLFTSGYTENAISHHGILDTGVNFIAKPYLPAALARKVRLLLDVRR